MRLFDERKLSSNRERHAVRLAADAYAASGDQALHVWDPDDYGDLILSIVKRAPRVFQRTRPWAHLLDNDVTRLKGTARALGVNVIVVDREGKHGQHVDLCGTPLIRAMRNCE